MNYEDKKNKIKQELLRYCEINKISPGKILFKVEWLSGYDKTDPKIISLQEMIEDHESWNLSAYIGDDWIDQLAKTDESLNVYGPMGIEHIRYTRFHESYDIDDPIDKPMVEEQLRELHWSNFVDWWHRMGYDDNYDINQNNNTTNQYFLDWLQDKGRFNNE